MAIYTSKSNTATQTASTEEPKETKKAPFQFQNWEVFGLKDPAQRVEEEVAVEVPSDESIASDIAKDTKKKKKTTTQQVLTSPLGATETAKTAVTKLGGY